MTKRHASLIPLTHDHHHTLAQARRLKEAHAENPATVRRAADDFVNFYLGRARHHFREEEELFFAPLVDDEVVGPLIARAVADHLRLHAQVRVLRRQLSVGDITSALLQDIAALLEAHVRFEEQELFPLIEAGIPEDELMDLAISGRRDV
jgi:iron-sulfur cluster repair protein YtfE (RIC family)